MTVDLTLAKAQCRVTGTAEDVLLQHYIDASAAWLVRFTGMLLAEGTVTDTFKEFGDFLQLSRGPFLELTSINYVDANGDDQTVSGARVRDGQIYPPDGGWPSIATYSTISAEYTAGFGGVYPLPEELTQAQLLLIGHWFSNREAVLVGETSKEIELAVDQLAGPFRLPTLR